MERSLLSHTNTPTKSSSTFNIVNVLSSLRIYGLLLLFIVLPSTVLGITGIGIYSSGNQVATLNTQNGNLILNAPTGFTIQSPTTLNNAISYSGGVLSLTVSTANALDQGSFDNVTVNQAIKVPASSASDCSTAAHVGRVRYNNQKLETCNGTAWQTIQLPSTVPAIREIPLPAMLLTPAETDIHIVSTNNIYVLGKQTSAPYDATLWKYNGTTWSTVGSSTITNLSSASASNTRFSYVSETEMYITTEIGNWPNLTINAYRYNGGASWTNLNFPYTGKHGYTNHYAENNELYIISQDSNNGSRGHAFKWVGGTWTDLGAINSSAFNFATIKKMSNGDLYATGSDGGIGYNHVVYKRLSGGTSWSLASTTHIPGSINSANTEFIGPNDIYTVHIKSDITRPGNAHQGLSRFDGTNYNYIGDVTYGHGDLPNINISPAGIVYMMAEEFGTGTGLYPFGSVLKRYNPATTKLETIARIGDGDIHVNYVSVDNNENIALIITGTTTGGNKLYIIENVQE